MSCDRFYQRIFAVLDALVLCGCTSGMAGCYRRSQLRTTQAAAVSTFLATGSRCATYINEMCRLQSCGCMVLHFNFFTMRNRLPSWFAANGFTDVAT